MPRHARAQWSIVAQRSRYTGGSPWSSPRIKNESQVLQNEAYGYVCDKKLFRRPAMFAPTASYGFTPRVNYNTHRYKPTFVKQVWCFHYRTRSSASFPFSQRLSPVEEGPRSPHCVQQRSLRAREQPSVSGMLVRPSIGHRRNLCVVESYSSR